MGFARDPEDDEIADGENSSPESFVAAVFESCVKTEAEKQPDQNADLNGGPPLSYLFCPSTDWSRQGKRRQSREYVAHDQADDDR